MADLGVMIFGVVVPPAPAALLFRLAFFSLAVPGVTGLLAVPILLFLDGSKGRSVLIGSGGAGVFFAGATALKG